MKATWSEGERVILLASAVLAVVTWRRWYWPLLKYRSFGRGAGPRCALLLGPAICAAILYWVLPAYASYDVRDDPGYLLLYGVLGAGWLGVLSIVIDFLGISPRDDAIERQNLGAAICSSGCLIALTLCYAGANIGDGPGLQAVLFSAIPPTAVLFGLWRELEYFAGLSEAITVDRDLATGIRLGGLLVAAGLILGRSAAGDWHSAWQTVVEFIEVGWPAVILWGVALVIERACRRSGYSPHGMAVTHGVLPALCYMLSAGLYIWWLGRWE